MQRAARLRHLKTMGGKVSKVVRAGLQPAIAFGSRCLGMPHSHVNAVRRIVSANLPGKHRGCSTSLRLSVRRAEPAHALRVPPVMQWSSAVWDGTVDEQTLKGAWMRQLPRIAALSGQSKNIRASAVHGPAAAVAVALKMAGWAWPHPCSFLTRDKVFLRLSAVCPCDVRDMYMLDSERDVGEVVRFERGLAIHRSPSSH